MGKGYARGKGRMRRAYLKPYMGKRPSAGNPNTDYTRMLREAAQLNDKKIAQLFALSKLPPNAPRKEVLDRIKGMRNGREDVHNHICMTPNNENHMVFLFWEIGMEHFYFVELSYVESFVRKSIGYPSRKFAMNEFALRRLRWVECIEFPGVTIAGRVSPSAG